MISAEEYQGLKRQEKELRRVIAEYEKRHFPAKLSEACLERPICDIRPCNHNVARIEECVFQYEKYIDSDIWRVLSLLGKYLHYRPFTFFVRNTFNWRGEPEFYVTEEDRVERFPRTYAELTPEQIKVSGSMVDEMIQIWNRYFVMCHPTTTCRNANGEYFRKLVAGVKEGRW